MPASLNDLHLADVPLALAVLLDPKAALPAGLPPPLLPDQLGILHALAAWSAYAPGLQSVQQRLSALPSGALDADVPGPTAGELDRRHDTLVRGLSALRQGYAHLAPWLPTTAAQAEAGLSALDMAPGLTRTPYLDESSHAASRTQSVVAHAPALSAVAVGDGQTLLTLVQEWLTAAAALGQRVAADALADAAVGSRAAAFALRTEAVGLLGDLRAAVEAAERYGTAPKGLATLAFAVADALATRRHVAKSAAAKAPSTSALPA